MSSTTIVIADDHDIIREGIKSLLERHGEYRIIGEAATGDEALRLVKKFNPDILLLDISMPRRSGLDVIEQAHYVSPDTKIVMITVHRANIYIEKAFNLGVRGYLHKENVAEDLLPALRHILQGEAYLSPKISQYIIDKVKFGNIGQKGDEGAVLSAREKDVLRLVVEGKTAKEIAQTLFISARTVENHKNSILKKLGLRKTSELIKYAIHNKIVEVED
ncbi:MAG: response regulator [Candidatus Omnitrophota bacterium]